MNQSLYSTKLFKQYIYSMWILLVILFALFSAIPSIEYNKSNLQMNRLIIKTSQEGITKIINIEAKDCQALLYSHMIASFDIEKAKDALKSSKECDDQDDVNYWAGELEYRQGNLSAAKKFWEAINNNYLLNWGANEYYIGNIDKAKFILEIAMSSERKVLFTSEQNSYLYSILAKIYQDEGDIQKSLNYSKIAWEEGNKPYDLAYQLGTQYYLTGQFLDAINVLEIGLQHKIIGKFYSQLDFSYYSRLAECYISLGDTHKGWYYYNLAKETIEKERQNKGSPEILEIQQNRLSNLKLSLESTP